MAYTSRYTNRPVQACDLAAHIVNANLAASKGVDLPFRYWTTSKYWLAEFKSQQHAARRLIEVYGEQVLLKVLQDPANSKTISLRAHWLIESKLKEALESLPPDDREWKPVERVSTDKVRPTPKKKTLRDLDDV